MNNEGQHLIQATGEDDRSMQATDNGGKQETNEGKLISVANAIVYPRAVMVQQQHTPVTSGAMVRTRHFEAITTMAIAKQFPFPAVFGVPSQFYVAGAKSASRIQVDQHQVIPRQKDKQVQKAANGGDVPPGNVQNGSAQPNHDDGGCCRNWPPVDPFS